MARAFRLVAAHPRWAAAGLGLVSATGFQPLGLWPLTLAALAGQIALIAAAPRRRDAAMLGWLFGWGHFALSLNWIATAFTYQAAMPPWLGWVAVVGLSAFLALYPALAAGAARALARQPQALVAALAGTWIIAEWLRSWVFTGFAWNPLGAVLLGGYDAPGLAALAPWLGTYGLSGLAVLLAGSVWLWLRQRAVLMPALFAVVLALAMLRPAPPRSDRGALPVTIVQPGIAQELLNDPLRYEDNVARAIALSRPTQAGQRRLVLWPESGVPWYLADGYPHWFYGDTYGADPALARQRLARAVGPGSLLLAGTVDLEVQGETAVGARNSVTALDGGSAAVRGRYAKAHLVPGGEYLPLRPLLEPLGLARLVPGAIDYWPGPGPATLDLGAWGKAGVQVCYEIIFSGRVTDRARRPDYLFNPTNDGWFGLWGPPQHLAQARLRAVEEGLPVLRATTTGISAVIDARGVVRAELGYGRAGRIDTVVPEAAAPTLFARLGNAVPLGWAAVLLALSVVASRRRPR